ALAISAVSIIYGQSFMLEASAVLYSIAALDAADRFGRGASWWWMALAAASLGLLVLSKIYMAVMLLPLAHLACPWRKPASNERPRHDPWASGTGNPWRVAAALTLLALVLLPAAAWDVHVMAITADHSPVA